MVATWAVLVACGGDDAAGKLPDAGGPPDAPLDTPSGPAPAILTVTIGHVLAPNITVYFQSKDSTKTEMKLTNIDGSASAIVEAGGFVTVLEPTNPIAEGAAPRILAARTSPRIAASASPRVLANDARRISTFAGVQPGDHLYVNIPAPNGEPEPTDDVEVTVRVPNEELGYTYSLHATCASGEIGRGNAPVRRGPRAIATPRATTAPRAIATPRATATPRAIAAAPVTNTFTFSNCGGKADVLVTGTDNDGVLRSWAYKPDIAITTGTVIEFTEYKQPVERTLSYTTAPNASVLVERSLRGARGEAFYWTSACVGTDNALGALTFDTPSPANITAETLSVPTRTQFSEQRVIDWGADANYTLDIPSIQLRPFTSAPSLDIANHAVTWTESPTGAAPDWTAASYDNTRTDANGTHQWQWRITGPYTAGILRYPVLPTTPIDYNAHAGDPTSAPFIAAVRGNTGYPDAQTHVFTADDTFHLAAARATPTGRLLLQLSDITGTACTAAPPAARPR